MNWKQIDNFPNYSVSDTGLVKSNVSNKLISIWTKKNGYCQVTLHRNGKKKNLYVHRLVATAFINNDQSLSDVNHIDENKKNNSVNNLEWLDHKKNCNYGRRNFKVSQKLSKPVIQIDLNGKIVNRFSSLISVEKEGYGFGNVANVCLGTKKEAYGYKWKYESEVL